MKQRKENEWVLLWLAWRLIQESVRKNIAVWPKLHRTAGHILEDRETPQDRQEVEPRRCVFKAMRQNSMPRPGYLDLGVRDMPFPFLKSTITDAAEQGLS